MHENNIERHRQRVIHGRRRFLLCGASLGLNALAFGETTWAAAKTASENARELSFYNLHTEEQLQTTYWSDGGYHPEALEDIAFLLRDHRTGDIKAIDPTLLNFLHEIQSLLDTREIVHVISGYRSPKTNAMLLQQGRGVAKHSLHMDGRAIDFHFPGIPLQRLREAAISLEAGGVGYYPKRHFVHIDTGTVRVW